MQVEREPGSERNGRYRNAEQPVRSADRPGVVRDLRQDLGGAEGDEREIHALGADRHGPRMREKTPTAATAVSATSQNDWVTCRYIRAET